MSTLLHKPFINPATARESLDELCGEFPGYHASGDAFREAAGEEMPEPYHKLLVHKRHMTLALSEHFGVAPNLYVMSELHDGNWYSRKIFLTAGNKSDSIELGVVRMDLSCLRENVAEQILRKGQPLGAILTEHHVLRRIEPRHYLFFPKGSAVLRWFGHGNAGPFYGRLGTIHCNEKPAIEVLEIVTLWKENIQI
ncbi:MAG: hypothetical protein ABSH20_01180 [Tepidisphaeraceae bacterium]|jgi:hypothetical protein